MGNEAKMCRGCILTGNIPGVEISTTGYCRYCREQKTKKVLKEEKVRYKKKFLCVLDEIKGKHPYDVLLAYSGGKDSTYLLWQAVKKYKLRVITATFDHGFVSPKAVENIALMTEKLDVDHVSIQLGVKTINAIFKKSLVKGLYPEKALQRASSICNSCMHLVKSLFLKMALEMRVPILMYGWSPGQIPIEASVIKTNPAMIRLTQKSTLGLFRQMVGERADAYFLQEEHFAKNGDHASYLFPYLVYPLAFEEYTEERVLNSVRKLGWVDPCDTDPNSTNCLLNAFANQVHLDQYGYNPYAFEIAKLIREGHMSREIGLKKILAPSDPKMVQYVRNKLRIK